MFTEFRRQFFQAVRQALGRILRASVLGLALGALIAELTGYFLNGGWPPQLFTHLAAGALALTLGYALAVTVAATEGVRGMLAAVSQIDDVVRVAADRGLDVADAVVDALDGPDRHGFRNKRGNTQPHLGRSQIEQYSVGVVSAVGEPNQ